MVNPISSVLTEQDEDIREVTPANAVLLRRLGLEALPAHETLILPTERLIVSGADHLARSAKRLVKSIQHVGILQNPSVVVQGGVDMHDDEATFEVIAGRRRVLAARLAGLTVVKCEVYAASTMQLSALLALIENEQRSAAWVREVEALRCLIDEGVGMTLDDLAAFGFDRATLAERLKIAQLPAPLLDCILSGNVSREVARKLVRLTQAQQERVASMALAGEEITAERVKDILRAQINTGLVPVQDALAQGWNATSSHLPVQYLIRRLFWHSRDVRNWQNRSGAWTGNVCRKHAKLPRHRHCPHCWLRSTPLSTVPITGRRRRPCRRSPRRSCNNCVLRFVTRH